MDLRSNKPWQNAMEILDFVLRIFWLVFIAIMVDGNWPK